MFSPVVVDLSLHDLPFDFDLDSGPVGCDRRGIDLGCAAVGARTARLLRDHGALSSGFDSGLACDGRRDRHLCALASVRRPSGVLVCPCYSRFPGKTTVRAVKVVWFRSGWSHDL